jgi:nucleotidyltransferase substrate binding protein (TIGR01987 family)
LLLEKANQSLEKVFNEDKILNDLEKDWVIQRFEYNIELTHKTLKKVLDYLKVDFESSPRDIVRESFRLWFIDNLELWNEFLDIRNQMSHVYSEYYSSDNFDFIKLHYKKIFELVQVLKNKFEI